MNGQLRLVKVKERLSMVIEEVENLINIGKMNLKSTKVFILLLTLSIGFLFTNKSQGQSDGVVIGVAAGVGAITFLTADAAIKETAKEVSQFRSKEYIMDYIIGPVGEEVIRFETESLASDDSAGVVSISFNCTQLDMRGLLLAFVGENRNEFGTLTTAYGFKYLPYDEAVALFKRIDKVKFDNKYYMKNENDVNNVYIEHDDMRFILYNDAGDKIRVFWNGFEVEWERTPFDRTKRRLERWFD